ncbi:protein OSB2, chloroplastic-like isoform X2 [Aristolochia californica]
MATAAHLSRAFTPISASKRLLLRSLFLSSSCYSTASLKTRDQIKEKPLSSSTSTSTSSAVEKGPEPIHAPQKEPVSDGQAIQRLSESYSRQNEIPQTNGRLSEPTISPTEEFAQNNRRFPGSTFSLVKEPPRRPSEIPWQAKVANSVHLTGLVKGPVHLEVLPDDKYWAVTTLVQEEYPQLQISIIFEGDWAQIAVLHLRENDLIYVTGKLNGDPPPFAVQKAQTGVQVLVQNLSFVQKSNFTKPVVKMQGSGKKHMQTIIFSGKPTKSNLNDNYWRDLITNPSQWLDYRMSKINKLVNPNFPDFKSKNTRVGLWLDSAPEWVVPEMNGLQFDTETSNGKKTRDSGDAVWRDLMDNPGQWLDQRTTKLQKLVKPTSPDFKHKVSGMGIWLDHAPQWVLLEIEGRKFDEKSFDESSWKDFVTNPNQWWDIRIAKLNGLLSGNYPDFKHKDSGFGLWLDNAPKWVMLKIDRLNLNPMTPDGNLHEDEDYVGKWWKELIANPEKWWDNRGDKLSGL